MLANAGSPKFVSKIIDGMTGNHTDEIFAREYQEVYNSLPIDERYINDIKCEIHRRLVTENDADMDEVHEAIKRLSAGTITEISVCRPIIFSLLMIPL